MDKFNDTQKIGDITKKILNEYHAYLWSELPKISKISNLILKVHGPHHPELSEVNKLYNILKMELEAHLSKEESILYPAIAQFEKDNSREDLNKAVSILKELEEEHLNIEDILKQLRAASKDYTVPDDGCETYEKTYVKLQELESSIFSHFQLENNILFPTLRNV